ncbi:hypothetical protein M231_05091 [Tremella mesenterica]|uniref:Uncharacterized protein n=1 Tax=Tremella mesenterica TaxID=5217 RepID=A0A4Q1BJ17_TREME|nr:hypothetical protein M231_05091 [Tremella mesenterica]
MSNVRYADDDLPWNDPVDGTPVQDSDLERIPGDEAPLVLTKESKAFEECLTEDYVRSEEPLSTQPKLRIFRDENIASKDNAGIAIHTPPKTLHPSSMAPGLVQALSILTGETDMRSRKITFDEWKTQGGTLSMLDSDQNYQDLKEVSLSDLIETVTLSVE